MKYLLFIVALIVLSCKKKTHFIQRHYYETGELFSEITYRLSDTLKDGVFKEFFKEGQLKKKIIFKNDKRIGLSIEFFKNGNYKFKEERRGDTIYASHFYDNGVLSTEGKFINSSPPIEIGWFKFYRKTRTLSDSVEYFKLGNKSHLNRRLHYGEDKKNIEDSSCFYKFHLKQIKDSIYDYTISYKPRIKDSNVLLIVGKDLNDNFSNIKDVKTDTIFMKNKNLKTRLILKNPYKHLKGFFYEHKTEIRDTIENDSLRMRIKEKFTYFNTLTKVN